jgi:hypothetical protein
MASGDVLVKTTTGLTVFGAFDGSSGGTPMWVLQLLGSSGDSDTPPNATVTTGGSPEATWPAGIVVTGSIGASPFDPAKKYDITVTEH